MELQVELEEGYGGLEVTSENADVTFQIDDNKVSFIMPNSDLSIVLRAYRLHSITYLYQPRNVSPSSFGSSAFFVTSFSAK